MRDWDRLDQRLRKRCRAGEPVGRSLGERCANGSVQLLRELLADPAHRRHRVTQALGYDRLRRGPGVGWFPGQHLVQDAAERVHVRPAVHRAGAGLFGAHVGRGAHRDPRGGHLTLAAGIERSCDPEVGHACLAVGEQDVLRFDVAMHDPCAVGVVEGRSDLPGDVEGGGEGELGLPAHAVAEGFAFHVGHRVPEEAARLT